MDAQAYWKIRALSTTVLLERERAERLVAAAQDRLDLAMREAGLDLRRRYRFDDTTETITAAAEE